MKGIMIYETPLRGNEKNVVYTQEVKYASYTLKQVGSDDITCYLEGIATKEPVTKATCNVNDTYDFETGALISLMKMCGLEKSAKAYAEIFDDTAYGDALIERDNLKEQVKDLWRYNNGLIRKIEQENRYIKEKDEEIEQLKEKNNGLYNLARKYVDEIDQKNHEIISLKALKISNESLKKDNESFRKTCEKLKEENFNLKTQISVMAEKETELINSNKRLANKSEMLNDALNTWKQRYRDLNDKNGELVVENYKLKTDCEKLQHGYIDEQINKLSTKRGDMWWHIKRFKGASCVEVNKADVIDFLEELEKEIPIIHWPTGDKPTAMKPMFNYKMWYECDKVYFFIDDDYVTYGFDKESSRTNVQYVTYFPPMRWDLFKKGRLVVRCKDNEVDEFKIAFENSEGPWYNFEKPLRRGGTYFYRYNKNTCWVEIICQLQPGQEIFDDNGKINGKKIVDWEDAR